jgi:hypothetical protein
MLRGINLLVLLVFFFLLEKKILSDIILSSFLRNILFSDFFHHFDLDKCIKIANFIMYLFNSIFKDSNPILEYCDLLYVLFRALKPIHKPFEMYSLKKTEHVDKEVSPNLLPEGDTQSFVFAFLVEDT